MLFELLRRHMRYILMGTVIIITPAFVCWGTGTGGGSAMSAAVAMRINGEDVSPRAFANAVQSAERRFGAENAVSNAIDYLLDDYVIRQACAELKIEVASAEIQERLKLNPSFRNADGSFNAERWNRTLRSKKADWSSALADARANLQREKVIDLVRSTVQVSPAEVRARYEQDHARRRVAYAEFAPDQFTEDVETDEAALQVYFESTPDRYREPTKLRLAIVQWKKAASALDKAEVQTLLTDLGRQLDEGADFAELARQYSQGPSAPQGGDLGYFLKGSKVKPFSEVAFALEVGAISPPVQTEFGWHIIKVEDRRETDDGETEVRARHILLNEEPSLETLTELFTAATEFAAAVEDRSVGAVAQDAGLDVTLTDPVAQTATTIPGVAEARDILDAAFALEPGQRTDVLDLPDVFAIVEVLERIDSHVPELAAIRAQVEADFRTQRAGTVAAERAAAVASAARRAGDLTAVDADLVGEVTETELFTRVGFIPDVGSPPAFMDAAFALEPGAISDPLQHGDRWFVLQVREAAPADPEEFETESAPLRERLERERRWQAVEDFLLARKATLQVEQNPQYVAGGAGGA